MPTLLRLPLVAPAGGTVDADPGIGGSHVRAGFLRMVERVSPALSAEFHREDAAQGLRAYTLSGLLDAAGRPWRGGLAPGDTGALLVGLLTDDLRVRLMTASEGPGLWMEVGGVRFEAAGPPAVARGSSCSALAQVAQRCGVGEIGFKFSSPTTFRVPGRSLLFPLPSLVFGGLWEKWAAFADCLLPGGLQPRVGEPPPDFDTALDVSRYELQTVKLTFRNDGREFPQRAFVGTCSFMPAKAGNPEVAAAARVLALYAEFAGVGSSTTMGLGRVERIGLRRGPGPGAKTCGVKPAHRGPAASS